MSITGRELQQPPPRPNAGAMANGVGRWVVKMAFQSISHPLWAALTSGLLGLGAVVVKGGLALVFAGGGAAIIVSATILTLGRRRRMKMAEFGALHETELAGYRREFVYSDARSDIGEGLDLALRRPEVVKHGIKHFIEMRALLPAAEAVRRAIFDQTGELHRVEIGIAEQDGELITVTHGSGRTIRAYAENAPCFAGKRSFKEVLARKAADDFRAGGYELVEVSGDDDENRYMFLMSTAPLGEPEKRALKHLSPMVRMVAQALRNLGLED